MADLDGRAQEPGAYVRLINYTGGMPTTPLVSWRRERAWIPLPLRVLGRYFITGQPLRGPGDNATFLHRATVDYRARPYVKLTGPIWQRLARRHAAVTVPLCLFLAAVLPQVSLWWLWGYLGVLVAAAGTWAGLRTRRWWRDRRAWKEFVDPAAQVLSKIIGHRYTKRWGRQAVQLPPGWGAGRDEGDGVRQVARVFLPAGTALSRSIRASITENVAARLGIPSPILAEWSETEPVFVDLSAAPVPPKSVTWASLLPAIAKAGPDEVVLGRGPGGRVISLSLAEDAPHVAMSGASGTGKSVLGRVFAVQRVALHGDGMLILDPKRWSHWRWAGTGKVDPSRIRYAWRTEELHEAWLEIAAEAQRRMEMDEEELAIQRRVFIMVEEISTQTKRLTRYWKAERKRIQVAAKLALADDPAADIDLGDLDPPAQSPAIVAMQESVAMGRELKMHVVVMAQRLSAGVFGGNGGDIRESFQGGRLIAKWDRKLWKMLVDTIDYVACPSGPRGIWGLARGEEFSIFRVPWLSEPDAREFLSSRGVPVYGPVLGVQGDKPAVDGVLAEDGPRAITAGVTLAEALDELPGQDGPAALTLSGLRRAANRPGFPEPLPKLDGTEYGKTESRLYDMAELVDWREGVLAGR